MRISWGFWVFIWLKAHAPIAVEFVSPSGEGNSRFVGEMAEKFSRLFGLSAVSYSSADRCSELKLVNRVAALAWQHVFGFADVDSLTKRIPDLVFNVTEPMRLAFLRGYLLGDGTVAHNRIAFSTSSYDIASGIVYCLSSVGVVPSISERDPDGVIREVNGAAMRDQTPTLDYQCLRQGRSTQTSIGVAGPFRRRQFAKIARYRREEV